MGRPTRARWSLARTAQYSVVRKHMQLMALREQPAAKEERPFLTTYRAFWMLMPLIPGLKVGHAYETHGPTITIQFQRDCPP